MEIAKRLSESFWDVSKFDGKKVKTPEPVPWHFKTMKETPEPVPWLPVPWYFKVAGLEGTVEAEGLWKAEWRAIRGETHRIHCKMVHGAVDEWDIVFVNENWFVGYNAGNLFRLGRRR